MATKFEEKLKKFSVDLFEVDGIKFGSYKTKVGVLTPVYCDLRVIVSHPKLLNNLGDLIVEMLKRQGIEVDVICGVPYTALPIATVVSLKTDIPMVMRRKEAKDYGTKKLIEGEFAQGDRCLIIEDVVTSGSSVLETVRDLEGSGLACREAIVLLNREQGGEKFLNKKNIKMHALLTLTQLVNYLFEAECVDQATVQEVKKYLGETQVSELPNKVDRRLLSYASRVEFTKNPVAAKIFKIMSEKKTSLCVAADLTLTTDILNLAEQVGPHICLLKTHVDIIEDFHPNFLAALQTIAERHNFLLFEDRKFADIGKTVQLQYNEGIYKISSWASVVTAHSVTGRGVLDAIKESSGVDEKGVFLLAETSAAGSLIDPNYTKATLKLAEDYSDLVVGVVAQNPLFLDKLGMIQLTPGVQVGSSGDNLLQQYNTPEIVVANGADVAVVGRGVTQAADPAAAALHYKKLLWAAYKMRIGSS